VDGLGGECLCLSGMDENTPGDRAKESLSWRMYPLPERKGKHLPTFCPWSRIALSWSHAVDMSKWPGEDVVDKIKIVLADDHALMREGTRELLEREEDLEVVGEAGNGEEAVKLAIELQPDVALIDIAMPKLNGIEATKQIKTDAPSVAVLILTVYDDDEYVFALLEAGAAGYLLKDVRARDLVAAIRSVHGGDSVLHPAVARKVVDRFARRGSKAGLESAVERLSDREMEVLKLAARGLSNKDIAQELVISIRTVQGHLHNIFGKMHVGSRTEAVVQALQKGWFTLEEGF
jgi:NarL family two-component system response regulator LiaR